MRQHGIQAYCSHPLRSEGRVIGTLSFGTKTRPCLAADDVELMRAIADQVAMGLRQLMVRRQLTTSNARLLEADQRKDEFLAMLSHELRNPLAPIKSGVEILARAPPGSDVARRAQVIMGRQVCHLSHLINDLLDVTRIVQGKVDLKKERLELGELALRCVDDHQAEFSKARVDLILQAVPGPILICGDRASPRAGHWQFASERRQVLPVRRADVRVARDGRFGLEGALARTRHRPRHRS